MAPAIPSPPPPGQRSQMLVNAAGSKRASQQRMAVERRQYRISSPQISDTSLLLGIEIDQLGRDRICTESATDAA